MIAELIKKDDRFEMCLSYKTIYNYIDMGVLMIDKKDLVYGNYRDKSKKERKRVLKPVSIKKVEPLEIAQKQQITDLRQAIMRWTWWKEKKKGMTPICWY